MGGRTSANAGLVAVLSLLFTGCVDEQTSFDDTLDLESERAPPPPRGRCRAGERAIVRGAGYPDAQSAIDAVGASGRVWLCPGTHAGPLVNRVAAQLEIASYSGNAADTFVDGQGTESLVVHSVVGYSALSLRGITFRGGYSAGYGTPLEPSAADVYVRNCSFHDNHSEFGTGTLLTHGDRTVIVDTTFVHNDGPVAVASLGSHAVAHLFRRLRFEGNQHPSSTLGVEFAAPTRYTREVVIDDVVFDGNVGGAAILANAGEALLGVRDVIVSGQVSSEVSGMSIAAQRAPLVTRVVLEDFVVFDSSGSSAVLELTGGWSPRVLDVTWTGGGLIRNTDVSTFAGAPPNRYGGAIGMERAVRLELADVDLGDGPDDNLMADIGNCAGEYGVATSGVIDPMQRQWCP